MDTLLMLGFLGEKERKRRLVGQRKFMSKVDAIHSSEQLLACSCIEQGQVSGGQI